MTNDEKVRELASAIWGKVCLKAIEFNALSNDDEDSSITAAILGVEGCKEVEDLLRSHLSPSPCGRQGHLEMHYVPHVHSKACYDDPGPANGHPFTVCDGVGICTLCEAERRARAEALEQAAANVNGAFDEICNNGSWQACLDDIADKIRALPGADPHWLERERLT